MKKKEEDKHDMKQSMVCETVISLVRNCRKSHSSIAWMGSKGICTTST